MRFVSDFNQKVSSGVSLLVVTLLSLGVAFGTVSVGTHLARSAERSLDEQLESRIQEMELIGQHLNAKKAQRNGVPAAQH